jgi:hypothetical protein
VTSHQVPAVVAYWAGLTKCSQLWRSCLLYRPQTKIDTFC